MGIFAKTGVYTLLFLAIARILPGNFYLDSVMTAVIASFILVLLNMTIKPVLHILAFPITFLTLGLFSIVINALMLELTSSFLSANFHFSSFGSAMMVAILLSIANSIINNYIYTNYSRG